MFTDEELHELLEFISGIGKFWHLGNGISTYPNGDENNKKIFAGCVELEKRGLVYRFIDEPEHVLFKAHPRSVQWDGGVCTCEYVDDDHRGTYLVCGQCLKPRR